MSVNKKIYLPDKHAVAFYHEKATAEFWDKHWKKDRLQAIVRGTRNDGRFIPLVKKYLPEKSIVLEGGCGMGQIVHALQYQGYQAIGVDYAAQTIHEIKEAVPELDVRYGDVRALDIPDASLDGYVSVGVIEHFWDGYDEIAGEMRRTLRTGGFLFVSFPYLSPLRKLKIALNGYSSQDSATMRAQQERFYQFALDDGKVREVFETLGFQFKERVTYSGIKGFKDEVGIFRTWIQEVYDGKRAGQLRPYLDKLLKPFASHMALLVLQKTT